MGATASPMASAWGCGIVLQPSSFVAISDALKQPVCQDTGQGVGKNKCRSEGGSRGSCREELKGPLLWPPAPLSPRHVAFQGQRKPPLQMLLVEWRDMGRIRPSACPWSLIKMNRTPMLLFQCLFPTPTSRGSDQLVRGRAWTYASLKLFR